MALFMDNNLLTSVSLTAYDHVDSLDAIENLEITIDADVFDEEPQILPGLLRLSHRRLDQIALSFQPSIGHTVEQG